MKQKLTEDQRSIKYLVSGVDQIFESEDEAREAYLAAIAAGRSSVRLQRREPIDAFERRFVIVEEYRAPVASAPASAPKRPAPRIPLKAMDEKDAEAQIGRCVEIEGGWVEITKLEVRVIRGGGLSERRYVGIGRRISAVRAVALNTKWKKKEEIARLESELRQAQGHYGMSSSEEIQALKARLDIARGN